MAMSVKHVPWVVIIAFTAIGVIVTTISAGVAWSSWNHLAGAERTEGVVVDLAHQGALHAVGTERPREPTPVVQYQVEGQTYRIKGHFAPMAPGYRIGEKVVLAYQPGHPSEGRIDSFGEMWLGPLAFGGVGLLFALIGFAMLRARIRSAGA